MLDSFPRVIQAELDRLHQNQQWLADKLGLSHASVSNWLRGERKPSAKSLEAVARVFGRTPSWIYEQMEQFEFEAVSTDPVVEPVEAASHPSPPAAPQPRRARPSGAQDFDDGVEGTGEMTGEQILAVQDLAPVCPTCGRERAAA